MTAPAMIGRGYVVAGVLLAMVALLAGAYALGHHHGAAAGELALAQQQQATATTAAQTSESARKAEARQANAFAGIAADYLKDAQNAYPSIADGLPAAIAAGTVQLRDACPAVSGGGLPGSAASARAADAAATQALADRTAAAIAAVRAGDAADQRERQLGAQVRALQALLQAERAEAAR